MVHRTFPKELKHSHLNQTGTFQHSYVHAPSSIQHFHHPTPRHPPVYYPFPHTAPTAVISVIITDRVDFFTSALCKSFILSPIHHHLSIYLGSCAICLSFPLLRLVRLVKQQLTELSFTKTHHHLLYPLPDDSS